MKLILSMILLAASSVCQAAPTFTKQYDACITDEIKRQGALLDAAYKAALHATPKERQPKLREAQRTWLKFSDQNCYFFHNAESTIASEARAYCVMRMTAERKAELDEIEAAAAGRG
jgi:uncharacterized protein YecT (DUF1311 family)